LTSLAPLLYEYFLSTNANGAIVNAEVNVSENSVYREKAKDSKIIIDEEEFSYNQIVKALNNTGVTAMEIWLSKKINNVKHSYES
jgi:hypothetical protein